MKKVIAFFISSCLLAGLFFALPAQAAEVEIHGELEWEFVSPGEDQDTDPYFGIDKFVIQPKVKIDDNIKLSAQYYFRGTGKSYLNEAHVIFSGLPLETYLDIGLFERAIKDHHSQKTETYSLYGNSFYRDDTFTIAWGNWKKEHKAPPLYWQVSAAAGYGFSSKQPAEVSAFKVIQDDYSYAGYPQASVKYPEVGLNVGINQKLGEAKVDVMGFYYTEKLSASELSKIKGYIPNGKFDDSRDKSRVGAQVNAKIGSSRVVVAFLSANDSGVGRIAYALDVSHKIKLGGGPFKSITPVLSYSGYTIDADPASYSESWDRSQIIVAGIFEVVKKTNVKVEYIINSEPNLPSGTKEKKNNELLVQLEVKF